MDRPPKGQGRGGFYSPLGSTPDLSGSRAGTCPPCAPSPPWGRVSSASYERSSVCDARAGGGEKNRRGIRAPIKAISRHEETRSVRALCSYEVQRRAVIIGAGLRTKEERAEK